MEETWRFRRGASFWSGALRPTPLIRLGAARRSTFSHKGRRYRRSHPSPITARPTHMPHQSVPPAKRAFARTIRREATEIEDRLWQELRGRRLDGIKFRRQVPVGRFVADFLCSDAMLIVEVDGSQHAESIRDDKRTAELNQLGFRVLRFWNDDVLKDMPGVCATILAYVRDTGLRPWR